MIRINKGDLLLAIGDNDPEIAHYLDRVTGEVIPVFNDMFEPEDPEYVDEDALIANPRYAAVEPVSSDEAFQWMARFARDTADVQLGDELNNALQRRRPFRSFKDALLAHPAAREAWFQFEELQLLRAAQSWLRSEDIDAEVTVDTLTDNQEPSARGND